MIGATEATLDKGVRLAPHETAAGRGFTDPARTPHDLAAVRVMLAGVRRVMSVAGAPAGPRALVMDGREADGRGHRTIVCNTERLRDGRAVAWVGFFAAKRRDVDAAPLHSVDDELIQEFSAHPGVLSYSSLEVGGGDWGNLILLDGDDAREHWRTSERHAHAARELAPRHYTDVRLHLGLLTGGIRAAETPILRMTKYYDYRDAVTWRGEREWPA
jgi:hypothetical protein